MNEGNETAQQVDGLLDGLDAGAGSRAEVSRAAERLVALGRDAVAWLVRSAVRGESGRRERAAAILACLAGTPARWALAEVERALDTRPLNPTEQMWLTTLFRRLEDAASGHDEREAERVPTDSLLDDETELLLWREEFASLPAEDQQATLAPILQEGNPSLLRLLEVAMSLRIAEVDATIAAGLSRFRTPDVLPLLRDLLRRPDPAVRKQAREAIAALERQGVDTRGLFVAHAESPEPVRAAFATAPQGDGRMAVLVARGRTPGQLRLVGVIIEPVEAGIATVSGEAGLSEAQLQEHLAKYARSMGQRLLRVDIQLAQSLVAAAEDYAVRQNRSLPSDYLVWRRYFGRPKTPVPLPIVFGPSCSQCGARLRYGDVTRGGVIVGKAALCARCAARPIACAACGRILDRLREPILAREGAQGAAVEFLCRACGADPAPRPHR